MTVFSVENSLNCHSSDDDSLSLGEQHVVAKQSTYVAVVYVGVVVLDDLTLEEETESLKNFEEESDNVGSGYWTGSCDWDEHWWGGG